MLIAIVVSAWKFLPKFEPNKLFIYLWSLQIIGGSLLLLGTYRPTGWLFLYIACCCIILLISAWLGKKTMTKVHFREQHYRLHEKRAVWVFFILFIPALLYPYVSLKINDISLENYLSGQGFLDLNFRVAELRYSLQYYEPAWASILLACVYFIPLYGGFIFLKLPRKKRWISFLSVLPALFIVLLLNTKSALISVVLLWIAAYIASFIDSGNLNKWKLKRRNIILIAVSGLAFFAILYGSLVFRLGTLNTTSIKTANYKLSIYALGHIGTTDKWFDTQKSDIPLFNNQWGIRSFYGISNPLHLAKREQGIYTRCTVYAYHYRKLSLDPEPPLRQSSVLIPLPEGAERVTIVLINNEKYKKRPMYSNIYTLFRPLMEDFGILGSFIFFAVMGFLASCAYYLLQKKNLFFIAVIVLSACLFFYCYYITSVWAYSTHIAAFVLFYAVLRLTFVKVSPKSDL